MCCFSSTEYIMIIQGDSCLMDITGGTWFLRSIWSITYIWTCVCSWTVTYLINLKYTFNLTSRNCFQYTRTCALSRFSKIPLLANSCHHSVVKSMSCSFWLSLFQLVQGHAVWLAMPGSQEGVYNNYKTTENRTHIDINFFDHEDLGNHLLQ